MKTMKRFVSLLLVAAMLASLPVVASAAVTHDHVHNYVLKETKAATCTAQGYKLYECSTCKGTYKADYTPSLHEFVSGTVTMTYVAATGSKAAHWEYKCPTCKKVIIEAKDNDCAKGSSLVVTKVYKDTAGHTKTVVDDNGTVTETISVPGYGFASGTAAVQSKIEAVIKTYNNGKYSKTEGGSTKYYDDAACTSEITEAAFNAAAAATTSSTLTGEEAVYVIHDILGKEPAGYTDTVAVETDQSGNKKYTLTKTDSTTETACTDKDGGALAAADFNKPAVTNTETVVSKLVEVDDMGNKKTTVGATVTYETSDGTAFTDGSYFASGSQKLESETKNKTGTGFSSDPSLHNDMKKTAIKVGNATEANCTNGGFTYYVSECSGCGMKFFEKAAGSSAHNFPTDGAYVKSGVHYTVSKQATASAVGYAYRTCKDCSYTEVVVIPKLNVTYPSYTTKGITVVYNDADAGNVQTVGSKKIGSLPKGVVVLVVESKNGFSKILAENADAGNFECWVKTTDLTLKNKAEKEPNCSIHGPLAEIYHTDATCLFDKMTTMQCETCDMYYVFSKTAGTKLAHKDKGGHLWQPIDPATFKIENDTAWTISKKPTETVDGEMQRVCATCGFKEVATGASTGSGYVYKDVAILKKTGAQNTKAYVKVAVAEVYDKTDSTKKITHYAVLGSNVTVAGYSMDKKWAFIKAGTLEGYTLTSNLKLDASSSIAASYDGATHHGIVADGSQLKVRLSYNETSSLVSTIPAGSRINIYEFVEASGSIWGRIDSKTADKWVKLGTGTVSSAGVPSFTSVNGMRAVKPLFVTYSISTPVAKLVDPIAKGHVTSTIGLTVRETATVQAKKLSEITYGVSAYIYETKTVNGVEWAKVKSIDGGATFGVQVTKAHLEDASTKLKDGWICMTYFALDTVIKTTATTPSASVSTGVVTTGGTALNVRKNADVYADKVGSLTNGTKVSIYQTKNASNGVAWGRISQDSLEGWVCMQYVTLSATSASGSGSASAAVAANAAVANCSTGVNVRTKADISGAQIAKIPVGTRIAVTKTSNGWGYVDSVKGWVFLEYVAFDAGALENLNNKVVVSGNNESEITTYTAITVPATVIGDTPVYTDHSTSSAKLMTLKVKDSIKVVDRAIVSGVKWYKISEGSVVGWINNISMIRMEAISGTVKNTLNVYASASVDSNVQTVLGAGSKFSVNAGNDNHFTEGVYAWAQLANGSGWIQLHMATLDGVYNATFEPTYADLPAITGSTVNKTVIYKAADKASDELVILEPNVNFTVEDWKYDTDGTSKITWGKITQGQYTGWIILQEDATLTVEQVSVGGTVTSEILNLYNEPDETKDVQRVLRKGDKVTVTERRLVGNAAWGRMVSATDSKKIELWANLANVQLDGQTVTSAPTTTTPGSTVTTTTPTAPTTVTIGVVTGADSVNVRSDAHVSSALVATVKKGEQVRVSEQKISDGANWGKIEQGWIAMQYVSLQASTVATTGTTSVTTGTTIMTSVPSGAIAAGFVSIDNLAVRSSAGVAMPQVGTLSQGTSVVIYETTYANNLYWGRTDGGWICMSYVVNTAVGAAGTGTAGTIARCFYTVNVRASAGTASAITGKIMVGSPVQILETTTYSGELWGRTNIGWVAMQYVA